MALKSEINCGPCEYSKLFVPAEVWCQLCEEGLCNDCTKHHKAAKATRTHEPVPISFDIQNKMYQVNTECRLHDEKFELYCPSHEMHCCVQCANNQHSECKGITLLNKFIENIKSSEVLASLKQTFQDRTKSCDELKENRVSNIRKLEEQSYKIVDEFENFENKAIENLNRNKVRLKREAEEFTAFKKQFIMETVDKLESQKTVYDKMLTSLVETERNSNNLQVYLMMKKLEEKLEKEDQITKTIEKEDGIHDVNISWAPNSEFHSFISKTNLGSIEVHTSRRRLTIRQKLTCSGQNALLPITKSHNYKLTVRTKLDTKPAITDYFEGEFVNISSIVILSNGDIIITDDGEKGGILIFDEKGNFKSKITIFGKAHSACLVNESLVAFSFPTNENIKLLKTYSNSTCMSLFKTFRIFHLCTGLSMSEGKIVACVRPTGIYIIDLDGKVLNKINIDIPNITYVHCFNKQMLLTDFDSDTISCFDMYGMELWTFPCESGEDVRNYCVDKLGNIFISEKKSGNILLLFPDKQTKTLVRNLDNPKAIAYDKDSNSLIVASSNGKHCIVYDINKF